MWYVQITQGLQRLIILFLHVSLCSSFYLALAYSCLIIEHELLSDGATCSFDSVHRVANQKSTKNTFGINQIYML